MNETSSLRRAGGWALLLAGLTGVACGFFLAYVPPAVTDDRFSYPLTADGYVAIQVFFFVHHLALAWGLLAVWRTGYAGRGVLAVMGAVASVGSMVLLAGQELVAISARDAAYPSPETDTIEGVYGVLSMFNGFALILLGIAVARARRWQGWPRFVVLALGIFVFVPLTPALFGPFVLARLTIGAWMLIFALLGVALLRPGRPEPTSPSDLLPGTTESVDHGPDAGPSAVTRSAEDQPLRRLPY
ncbi:hypothetical protein [Luedemannella helvata]|uniref:DUF4386 family protein n=1 Tax=Luedemannella helvata TaxID=349315 RepID=A0ABN2KGA0_9ACTN